MAFINGWNEECKKQKLSFKQSDVARAIVTRALRKRWTFANETNRKDFTATMNHRIRNVCYHVSREGSKNREQPERLRTK